MHLNFICNQIKKKLMQMITQKNDALFCNWVCNYTIEVSMKCLTSIACELS